MVGSPKHRNVGESQPVLIMIDPMISPRTRKHRARWTVQKAAMALTQARSERSSSTSTPKRSKQLPPTRGLKRPLACPDRITFTTASSIAASALPTSRPSRCSCRRKGPSDLQRTSQAHQCQPAPARPAQRHCGAGRQRIITITVITITTTTTTITVHLPGEHRALGVALVDVGALLRGRLLVVRAPGRLRAISMPHRPASSAPPPHAALPPSARRARDHTLRNARHRTHRRRVGEMHVGVGALRLVGRPALGREQSQPVLVQQHAQWVDLAHCQNPPSPAPGTQQGTCTVSGCYGALIVNPAYAAPSSSPCDRIHGGQ
jgi:hypothetical protein